PHPPLCSSHAPATPATHTLSLHDALPICISRTNGAIFTKFGRAPATLTIRMTLSFSARAELLPTGDRLLRWALTLMSQSPIQVRSEEHTSELQSRFDLVCRLLLEKKK